VVSGGDIPDVKVGETYRLTSGDEVTVEKVEQNTVRGTIKPAAHTATGISGTAGIGVYVRPLEELRGAEKIR
jgi:hypothetical protein